MVYYAGSSHQSLLACFPLMNVFLNATSLQAQWVLLHARSLSTNCLTRLSAMTMILHGLVSLLYWINNCRICLCWKSSSGNQSVIVLEINSWFYFSRSVSPYQYGNKNDKEKGSENSRQVRRKLTGFYTVSTNKFLITKSQLQNDTLVEDICGCAVLWN